MSIRAARTEVASQASFGEGVDLFHPDSIAEIAEYLAEATAKRRNVLVWGGGTHQEIGYRVQPDVVLFTNRLNQMIDWEPDDLTVVVEAGMRVAELEAQLATRGQTAVLPENPGASTVGGMLATGSSAYRRARYGPTRDRILEVQVVTGDGRVIRGGGRVVKNVTGYDLPRLVVGSFGSMGVIVSSCFKLWPAPPATATVSIGAQDPVNIHRPLAVLSDGQISRVYLGGTEAEVKDQVSRLGNEAVDGLVWPTLPESAWTFSLRVPPDAASQLLAKLPRETSYIHQVGVGEIAIAAPSVEGMEGLRISAEAAGGALVVTHRSDEDFDPWGTSPATLELQRQLIAAFDPARVINPGLLPGRI